MCRFGWPKGRVFLQLDMAENRGSISVLYEIWFIFLSREISLQFYRVMGHLFNLSESSSSWGLRVGVLVSDIEKSLYCPPLLSAKRSTGGLSLGCEVLDSALYFRIHPSCRSCVR